MADFIKIGKLIENLTGFVRVKIELLKLEILEEISKGIANLFTLLIALILGLFIIAFSSLTLAIFLNHYLESHYTGYLIVTGFYIIILVIFLFLNRSGKLTQVIEDRLVHESKEIMEKSGEKDE